MKNVNFSLSVIQENKAMSPRWGWGKKPGSGAGWQAPVYNLQQVGVLQGSCHLLLVHCMLWGMGLWSNMHIHLKLLLVLLTCDHPQLPRVVSEGVSVFQEHPHSPRRLLPIITELLQTTVWVHFYAQSWVFIPLSTTQNHEPGVCVFNAWEGVTLVQ